METVITKKEIPNPWEGKRYAISKDLCDISTREVINANYETKEITIKEQEDFIRISLKIARDNDTSFKVNEELGYPNYTVKKLIML